MTASTAVPPDLNEIEDLLELVSAALMAGNAQDLMVASTALRDAVAALAGGVSRGKAGAVRLDPALRQRMEDLSLQMARQREGVRRRAVVVERALSTVLPGEDDTTYASKVPTGRKKTSPARIYTALAT